MTGAAIAAVLYALPILAGIRHFSDEVDGAKEWMRSEDGEWYPALAPWVAALGLLLWPLVVALDCITQPDGKP